MARHAKRIGQQTRRGFIEEELKHLSRHAWLPVLLLGPTGSGKSFWAKKLHGSSSRARKSFVTINCAALPPDLLEAELFGSEAGAFTGAVRRAGKFEQADGGTLFLDEIGELPLALQAKLLLAVEAGQVTRLGGAKPVPIDARLIYATHQDLAAEVAAGQFRADLYFRLAGAVVALGPLTERVSEIPGLARAAVAEVSQKLGRTFTVSTRASQLLARVAWPGNIRQLRHCVTQATLLAARQPTGLIISQRHVKPYLPEGLTGLLTGPNTFGPGVTPVGADGGPAPSHWLSWTDVDFVARYLELAASDLSQAAIARWFGCDRTTLFRRARRLGLARQVPGAGGRSWGLSAGPTDSIPTEEAFVH